MKINITVLGVGEPRNVYGQIMTPIKLDLNENGFTTNKYALGEIPLDTKIVTADLVDFKGTLQLKHIKPFASSADDVEF